MSANRQFLHDSCESVQVLQEDFWDEALVGYVEKINFGPVACYDWDKLVAAAMKVFDDDFVSFNNSGEPARFNRHIR